MLKGDRLRLFFFFFSLLFLFAAVLRIPPWQRPLNLSSSASGLVYLLHSNTCGHTVGAQPPTVPPLRVRFTVSN